MVTPSSKRQATNGNRPDEILSQIYRQGAWQSYDKLVKVTENKEFFLEEHIAAFPTKVIMSFRDDLGVVGLNATASADLVIGGLANKKNTGDGMDMWPDIYFRHDLTHERNKQYALNRLDEDLSILHQRFITNATALKGRKRRQVEVRYLYMTHEDLIRVMFGNRSRLASYLKESFASLTKELMDESLLAALAKMDVDVKSKEAVEAYLREADAAFLDLLYPRFFSSTR